MVLGQEEDPCGVFDNRDRNETDLLSKVLKWIGIVFTAYIGWTTLNLKVTTMVTSLFHCATFVLALHNVSRYDVCTDTTWIENWNHWMLDPLIALHLSKSRFWGVFSQN